jgi:phage shock protein E
MNMSVEKIIKEKQCTIVDVRSREEFMGGNADGSINIPLPEIEQRIDELKTLKQPLVLCCASGGRSGLATNLLMQKGIQSYNAGSWLDVNYYQSQSV